MDTPYKTSTSGLTVQEDQNTAVKKQCPQLRVRAEFYHTAKLSLICNSKFLHHHDHRHDRNGDRRGEDQQRISDLSDNLLSYYGAYRNTGVGID